jgi:hypothetical protein
MILIDTSAGSVLRFGLLILRAIHGLRRHRLKDPATLCAWIQLDVDS